MSLLQHHQPDLAILYIAGGYGIAGQPFNLRPVRVKVFVSLNLCWELRFQDAILSLVAVRDLKRNALRSFGNLLRGRHDCTSHRSFLSEFLIRSGFWGRLTYRALVRPYCDRPRVPA